MWQVRAPFAGWVLASVLIGLGFTFFSGATEAWLVDALADAGHTGDLETVFGRAQLVSGAAMLVGSLLGGVVAQFGDLGLPYLIRSGVLVLSTVVAWFAMHDRGFVPDRSARPLQAVRTVLDASIDQGLRKRPVRWLMLAAPFTSGVGIYVFYALQPYLLQLAGDPRAYGIAGAAAALSAGAQMVGGLLVGRIRRLFRRRTDALILGAVIGVGLLVGLGVAPNLWTALALVAVWSLTAAAITPLRQSFLNGRSRPPSGPPSCRSTR